MGLIKGQVCGTLMLFIDFSVVLITMAAVKVDADTCEGMPRMFLAVFMCSSGAGSKVQCPARSPQPQDSRRRRRGHGRQ